LKMLHVARHVGLKQRQAGEVAAVFGFQTLNQAINLHKFMCFFVVLGMIIVAEKTESLTPCIYLAMHGCYGWCWILKYLYFPDWGFEMNLWPATFIFCFVSAAVHWVTSWLIVTAKEEATPLIVTSALMSYIIGMFMMYVGDGQKYIFLKYRKGHLLREGIFTHTRNPNYLGEILIYLGYCLLSRHWVPWVICVSFWIFLFAPNILAKEKSLSRYPDWEAYKSHSGALVPNPFGQWPEISKKRQPLTGATEGSKQKCR